MIKRGLLALSDHKSSALSPLASLMLLSFLWSMSFSKEMMLSKALFPGFLCLFSVSLLILSLISLYGSDVKNGFLMLLVGNKASLQRYVFSHYIASVVYGIVPMTILCTGIFALSQQGTYSSIVIFFLSHLSSCLVTLSLTHILSALSAHEEKRGVHSLFLLWPFLVPSLLLSLAAMSSETLTSAVYIILLNFSLVFIFFGAMLLLTPYLLETLFDTD